MNNPEQPLFCMAQAAAKTRHLPASFFAETVKKQTADSWKTGKVFQKSMPADCRI
jgi:hypothetical protein